jgi:hypothetical protein
MFLVTDKIVDVSGSIDEMRALLQKDEYNYACFLYSDPLSLLFDRVKPEKVRLIGDWEGQNFFFPDVPTSFLYPSEDNYKFAASQPLVHFSCLGWTVDSISWTENRMTEDKYAQRLQGLAKFAAKKRLFFYGTRPEEEYGGIRRSRRFEQLSVLGRCGFTIVSSKSKFVPTQERKLIDLLEEEECVAALGLDGLSIGCKRDHELLLSAVPFVRVTHKNEYLPFVDPLHMGWAIPVGDAKDCLETWNEIKNGLVDGSLVKKLFSARDMSSYFFENARFMQVLDAVSFDSNMSYELLRGLTAEELTQGDAVKHVLDNTKPIKATTTDGYTFCSSQGEVLPHKYSISIPEKLKEKSIHLPQALVVSSVGKEIPVAPKLSFVIPCMGRLEHLKQSLPSLSAQVGSEVIVVDWSCPDKCGEWAALWPITRVVNVVGEKNFSLPKSRNIGAKAARGEWLCFLDCDMVVSQDFSKIVIDTIRNKLERPDKKSTTNYFISFGINSQAGYAGMTICRKEDWEAVGGYDEQMEGWGWEDTDFKNRLEQIKLVPYFISKDLATHIEHGNEERVKYYDQKDQNASHAKNQELSYKRLEHIRSMAGFWSVTHASWTGIIMFSENGTFERYKHHDKGTWRIEGNQLFLKWLQWPTEKLEEKAPDCYVGKDIIIRKARGGIESWASYFELGGGLGDKLCALSAIREYTKDTTHRIKISNPELADVIEAFDDKIVSFGLGGTKLSCDNGPKHFGRNYLEAFRSSLDLPLGSLPRLQLPNVPQHPDYLPGTYIVVQPVGKSWVNLSDATMQALVDKCAQYGKVVVVGDTKTPKTLNGVEYVLDHNILVMLKLIKHAKAVLSPHSASAHIASGYCVPTLIWADLDVKHEMHYEYPGWNKVRVSPQATITELTQALEDLLSGKEKKPVGLTTKTAGRLGNEMFQYSVTRLLAEADALPFKVPCKHINKEFANLEMEMGEASSYLNISGDPYYHSFGSCVDLVLRNKDRIKEWFPISGRGREILESMGNPPVVHVRATDFQGMEWTLGSLYYSAAVSLLSSKPIIVTDDPKYAKTLFPDHTILNTKDDFSILANAKELVCSYSTYCWWAAFLGEHSLVIAPEKDELFVRSSRTLNWRVIPCVLGEDPAPVSNPAPTGGETAISTIDIVGEWRVNHAQWADVIKIESDGSFVREGAAWDTGVWELSGDNLILRWKRWDPEEAKIVDGNLVGKKFVATRKWKLKNPKVSFCTTCKGRLWQLKQTYIQNIETAMAEYPRVEFILLDYNSQDGLEQWAKENLRQYVDKGVLKYFKLKDDLPWHASKSRNMAHRLASGDILCNVDADNFLEEGFTARIAASIGPKRAARLSGFKSVGGRIALYRGDFYDVGGYDESFAPMGHLDTDLENRLKMNNVTVSLWPYTILPIHNEDKHRAEFCEGLSYEECCRINKKKMAENLINKRIKVNE